MSTRSVSVACVLLGLVVFADAVAAKTKPPKGAKKVSGGAWTVWSVVAKKGTGSARPAEMDVVTYTVALDEQAPETGTKPLNDSQLRWPRGVLKDMVVGERRRVWVWDAADSCDHGGCVETLATGVVELAAIESRHDALPGGLRIQAGPFNPKAGGYDTIEVSDGKRRARVALPFAVYELREVRLSPADGMVTIKLRGSTAETEARFPLAELQARVKKGR